jgi:hypothetical protein
MTDVLQDSQFRNGTATWSRSHSHCLGGERNKMACECTANWSAGEKGTLTVKASTAVGPLSIS